MNRESDYRAVTARITALLEGEYDEVAALATVSCELFQSFDTFHWVGFYRVTEPNLLTVGPYQGGHGCLRIPFDKGVCGAAARLAETQLVEDVNQFPGHIACASSTESEIVVPVFDPDGEVVAVLDIDSDLPAHFNLQDQKALEKICTMLTRFYKP